MDSPVRALTVPALYLISEDQAGVQLDLLGQADAPRRDRLERLDRTLDQIRAKYGRNAISPASSAGVCQGGVQEEDEEGASSRPARNRCPASAKEAAATRFPKESLDQLQQLTHIQAEVRPFAAIQGCSARNSKFCFMEGPFYKKGPCLSYS